MLRVLDKRMEEFVQFLNNKYPCNADIRILPLHGYDSVTSDASGAEGFAVFLPEENIIMLPMDVPQNILEENDEELTRDFVIHNLAHEYAHALQFNGDRKADEDKLEEDADIFAERAVREFVDFQIALSRSTEFPGVGYILPAEYVQKELQESDAINITIDNPLADPNLVFSCRKCGHCLSIKSTARNAMQVGKILDKTECPNCGENPHGNWTFLRFGKIDEEDISDLSR